MSVAGAMVIGLLTGTFYYCSEAASKESTEGKKKKKNKSDTIKVTIR